MTIHKRKFQIGDYIRILNENGQYDRWTHKTWRISDIAYSEKDRRGYDSGMAGMGLISCDDLPVSLYEYEIEKV